MAAYGTYGKHMAAHVTYGAYGTYMAHIWCIYDTHLVNKQYNVSHCTENEIGNRLNGDFITE